MKPDELNENYWENRFKTNDTSWDIGSISRPLKEYFDTLSDKNIKILIPGCGRAYEAEYLHKKGFKNVFPADITASAKIEFFERVPDFPKENWISNDFFEINGKFDLIIEQTFFCALHPEIRIKYAKKMTDLLTNEGVLAGLLFDDFVNAAEPPFGGNKAEYCKIFEPYFTIEKMEKCYNSIPARTNRELFFRLKKKII